MHCMKCCREISEGNVFCDTCLEDMSAYPVKPGTPIQLPARTPVTEEKKKSPRIKKETSPEQRLRQQRAAIRLLTLALTITLVAFVLLCFFALQLLDQRDRNVPFFPNFSDSYSQVVSRETITD